MARQYLDVRGAAAYLPFSRNAIYKHIHDPLNPIPHKRFKGKILFEKERLDKWFDRLPGRDDGDLS